MAKKSNAKKSNINRAIGTDPSPLTYRGKTNIDKLHAMALMADTDLKDVNKLIYQCYLISGAVMLSEDTKDSVVIVIAKNSRYIQSIQRILNDIFEESNIPKMDFGDRQTYGVGLFSVGANVVVRFCINEDEYLGYNEYFLIDTRI